MCEATYYQKNREIIPNRGKNIITDHNHDKYITPLEFNNLAAGLFTTRLAQANLVTGTEFDTNLKSLNEKINSNIAKHLLVKNKLKKSYKHLVQFILEEIFILKKIFLKIIEYVNQCKNIFKRLVVLAMVSIFMFGNLKVCLMKKSIRLLHLITVLLQN